MDDKKRPTRTRKKVKLFEIEPSWKEEWWGMPDFNMEDASPQFRIVMNFMTAEDVKDFAEKLGTTRITTRTDSAWWPPQKRLNGEYVYSGKPTDSRYPICIPSKGRADCQKTGKLLDELGTSYLFFVEETEYNSYCEHLGEDKVICMPFHDLGKGSIPARNFIWNWAEENSFKRHWIIDDNITTFTRCNNNRRLRVTGGGFFRSMEDFVDRYENIALAGPHDQGFVSDRDSKLTPFLLNSRVYSCTLIDTSLPHRWRGKYNEDTDLCIRVLKDGYCTLLFRSLLMNKMGTHTGAGKTKGAMKGGNTDNVYNGEDHRRSFAESLKKQHPDIVEVVWKFGRWHHQVDYSKFKRNKLIPRSDITPILGNDEYGMELIRK